MVSLEALSYGCPIVVSDARFVPLKTYFSHQPYVINQLDVIDIEKVVLKAYRERTVVSEDQEFSWEVTAIQTNNAYKELLDDLSAN